MTFPAAPAGETGGKAAPLLRPERLARARPRGRGTAAHPCPTPAVPPLDAVATSRSEEVRARGELRRGNSVGGVRRGRGPWPEARARACGGARAAAAGRGGRGVGQAVQEGVMTCLCRLVADLPCCLSTCWSSFEICRLPLEARGGGGNPPPEGLPPRKWLKWVGVSFEDVQTFPS